MYKDYFLETFKYILRKTAPVNDQEVMCEKFFVLLESRVKYWKQAAIFYFFEIYPLEGVAETLEEQYQFGLREWYGITGNYLPEMISSGRQYGLQAK